VLSCLLPTRVELSVANTCWAVCCQHVLSCLLYCSTWCLTLSTVTEHESWRSVSALNINIRFLTIENRRLPKDSWKFLRVLGVKPKARLKTHAKLNGLVFSWYNAQSNIQHNLTPVWVGVGKFYFNSQTYLAPTEEFIKHRLQFLSINRWYCAPDKKAAASYTSRALSWRVQLHWIVWRSICHTAQFIFLCIADVWTHSVK